jgi:F-type H+-transporting ATPase subunit b
MFLAESTIQLVPDGTLLLHLLMISVMVAVLNRTLLRPINKILEDREKYILGRVESAQEMLKAREQKLDHYNSALREARTEGYHLLEKERAQAVKEKEEKIRAFKAEASRMLAKEILSTQNQERKIRSDLEAEAQTLGKMITSQILRPISNQTITR